MDNTAAEAHEDLLKENISSRHTFVYAPEKAENFFAEDVPSEALLEQTKKIVIYRWNRHYPSDMKFPTSVFAERWKLMETREFPGSSHDLITEEVYTL